MQYTCLKLLTLINMLSVIMLLFSLNYSKYSLFNDNVSTTMTLGLHIWLIKKQFQDFKLVLKL